MGAGELRIFLLHYFDLDLHHDTFNLKLIMHANEVEWINNAQQMIHNWYTFTNKTLQKDFAQYLLMLKYEKINMFI